MNFEKEYTQFIASHLACRTGERRDRLERGHQHAEQLFCEQVWFPLQSNFEGLHPEYEVLDWRSQRYFCDFVWMAQGTKVAIEIKGFGAHIQQMDRRKFCNELNRETFLTAMGFHVISFAYGEVAVIRLACTLGRPLRTIDLEKHFNLGYRASIKLMQLLCEKKLFEIVRGKQGKYVIGYRLRSEAFTKL